MPVQNFSNIVLFDHRGYEIELQRLFNFEFKISFATRIPFYVVKEPNLCVIGNSDLENPEFKVFVNEGGIFRVKENYDWSDEFFNSSLYNYVNVEIIYHAKNTNAYVLNNSRGLTKDMFSFAFDEVEIFSEDINEPSSIEYKIKSVNVTDSFIELVYKFLYGSNGANAETNKREITIPGVAQSVGAKNLYPFYNFIGVYKQEPVSTELVSATTFFMLSEETEDSEKVYKPISSEEYDLILSFQENSEVSFIENNKNIDEISWSKTHIINLLSSEEIPETEYPTPEAFSIGFSSNEEGCFQNNLRVYARSKANKDIFYLGSITIRSESIGEDERYRTLFTNFGIPDPITYPNLFKEQDPEEEGVDFELINRKSKELFLTYDKIFPYVGTYKALINAVKFLGYNDIYFKEWYKIIDKDRESTNALFTSVDFANGTIIPSSLAKYGISPEDFFNYKKLNKLSLIYLLNVIKDDYDIQTVKNENGEKTKLYFDVPSVIRNFEYTNDAILAKLYSLKAWLEKYIIGVNARISDVTGEGIYFYRFETTAYSTAHVLIDYFNENHLTPYQVKNSASDGRMIESSANLVCSVYEFDNMKFSDYNKITFRDFIYELGVLTLGDSGRIEAHFTNDASVIEHYVPTTHVIDSVIPISHSIEAPLLFNELSYNLETESSCGTLYEYATEDTSNNPILIKDNKIEFYDSTYIESKICNNCLPTIVLKKANLRKTYGDWSDNIVYTIKPIFNTDTSETMYQMQLVTYPTSSSTYFGSLPKILSNNDIVLSPYVISSIDGSSGLTNKTIDPSASFKYTQKTKYNVPLFIISKYTLDIDSASKEYFNIKDSEFILEILDGELRFDTKTINNIAGDVGVAMTSEITFSMEDWNNYTGNARDEQIITPVYNFQTEKFNIIEYTLEDSEILDDACDIIFNNEKRTYYKKLNDIKEAKKKLFIRRAISELNLPWVDEFDRSIFNDPSITYDEILEDVSKGIGERGHTLQLDDTYNGLFIDASAKINEYVEDSIRVDLTNLDKQLYIDFNALIKDPSVYKVNKNINVNVNRLGNYRLSAFGYDKYNNIFTNQCNIPLKVFGVAPEIDLYTNTSYSNNSSNFYKANTYGKLLYELNDETHVLTGSDLISKFEDKPRFPKTYRIYDISFGKDELSYPSISYAIDSPKSTDYLHFNNFTEVATRIEKDYSTGYLTISMLDENADCSEVYYYNCAIMIYVFDNIHLDLVYTFGPTNVKNFYKQESLTDTNYYDDSYIQIACHTDSELNKDDVIEEINTHISKIGDWTTFIVPITETIIDNNLVTLYNEEGVGKVSMLIAKNDLIEDPSINYATMLTPMYHVGDVIKLTYEIFNEKFSDYNFFNYKGETSYRITNVESHKTYINGTIDSYENIAAITHIYSLDGSVNTHLIDGLYNNKEFTRNSSIYCKMSNPCFEFVHFITNAKSKGAEEVIIKNVENNVNETLETRMTVAYDSSNWFVNNYLDNTYSMYDIDYTPEKLKLDWYNASTLFNSSTEIYRYSNFPITLEKDRVLVVSSADREKTFESYNSRWKWMIRYADKNDYYSLDDEYYIGINKNAPIQKVDSILYRSINDIISIKTNYAGNNDIILEAIDKFGNRLYNNGEGILFIDNAHQAEQLSLIN